MIKTCDIAVLDGCVKDTARKGVGRERGPESMLDGRHELNSHGEPRHIYLGPPGIVVRKRQGFHPQQRCGGGGECEWSGSLFELASLMADSASLATTSSGTRG